MKEIVLVIGGDKRQILAAEMIADRGYTVYITGFEKLPAVPKLKIAEPSALPYSDYILLPAPFSDAEGYIRMPYSDAKLALTTLCPQFNPDACVILGGVDLCTQSLLESCGLTHVDLLTDEPYTARNAFLTSQAAVMLAGTKSMKALSDCNILICGFGNIGKTLAGLLKGFHSRVTVSARKDRDLEWIGILGYHAVETSEVHTIIHEQDIVFNTIPARVIGQNELAKAKKGVLMMELASKPYGIDFDAASSLGLNTVIEPGLPGRCFPVSAAAAVTDAFQRIAVKGW
jgi:dipicolinate synthase subunit A